MAGIYIHIPFCRQACTYCDFHFSTRLSLASEMVKAIHREIELRTEYLGTRQISSVYFGGGTPSILSSDELLFLMDALQANFSIDNNAEITLETNPDDITQHALAGWRNAGINRLSIGLQSFNDEELRWMNRLHTGAEGKSSVWRAQDAGFSNISIDLIYGSRFQDLLSWEKMLLQARDLKVQHISSYNLTVEAKTKLAWLVAAGKEKLVDELLSSEMFSLMTDFLTGEGYDHYEISNFGKPGFIARHNSSYWLQQPYMGVGPAAHSFNGETRQWNVRNNPLYIKAINTGERFFEIEHLTAKDRYNEYVLTRLRTKWGCDLSEMRSLFDESSLNHFLKITGSKMAYMREQDGVFTLNREGRLRADGLASDLFLV